ncbi:MAG TPA: DUF1152 domain-containing protein [Candidatus Acidoferrales bacterium]|nr:DUF1152 domain-containing protein [Candidatus Acidoferrales bacterium]
MPIAPVSLEQIIRSSKHALVVGVGGGGDVVGALAAARFFEFCGLRCTLGGLSWERFVYDPKPGPRHLSEIENFRPINSAVAMANATTRTRDGILFAESRMAAVLGQEILLVDINGGAAQVIEAIDHAAKALEADLLVGLDVGGDSLAQGGEPGLRSPLADSIMLAAWHALSARGWPALWGIFGYGSDGELTTEEIELALGVVARAGGLLGAWALTPKVVSELEEVIKEVHTEASAVPVECARGAWGEKRIRTDQRKVKLTPLTTLTFYVAPSVLFEALSRPARAVASSRSLEEANEALHALGLKTELDLERQRYNQRTG